MKTLILFGLALMSSATAVTPAAAQERAISIVRTADLDLASDSGRQALDERIVRAAREVCGTASDVDLEGKNAVRACRAQVIAEASAQRDQILVEKSSDVIQIAVR